MAVWLAILATTALQPAAASAYEKRINCGELNTVFVSSRGDTFTPDIAYTAQNGAGFIGGFDQSTWQPIGGTPDPQIFMKTRENWNEYRFDVPNGTYIVRLDFADLPTHGPGINIFDLAIEGQIVLDDFDLHARAGGHYAVTYPFAVTVNDGQLNVTATPVLGLIQLNAIEVWDATPDAEAPATPAGVIVRSSYAGVLIDWQDNMEEDLAGYHVERAESVSGPWQRLTPNLARRSRHEDLTALPTHPPYHYRVIAADVWGNSSAASTPLTGEVLLDSATSLPTYRITIDPGIWKLLNQNVNFDNYYPASFTYNGQVWNNVGVRYRGNTSRSVAKKSWKIKFNEFIAGQEFLDGQTELNLDSTHGERTLLREKLGSDFCELVGIPVYNAKHAQLRVNGEFFGVYTAVENVDGRWLRENGFDTGGSLYEVEGGPGDECADLKPLAADSLYQIYYPKKTNESTGYGHLIQFIELINNTPASEIYNVLAPVFDIESFIEYYAAMIALSNDSFFCRNYYLYHDEFVTGRWTYLPDDLDTTFGHLGIYESNVNFNNPLDEGGLSNELIRRLINSPHVRRRVYERLLEMMEEDMAPARMDPVIDAAHVRMAGDARLDWRKWGWEDPTWTDGGAAEIKGYIPLRQDYVALRAPTPQYMPPQTFFLNEIMADNDSVLADEMGEYEDWIEFVNLGASPVSLAGHYLTDDIALPTKWAVPDTTVPPGGHILFWCDRDTLQGPTHTNFALEKTGEWVGLFGPDQDGNHPIDSKSFGGQVKDVSYGRYPDGGYNWTLMGTPTPWDANLPQGNLPPAISQVETIPATPGLNEPVLVTARILDDTGVAAASCFYGTGSTFTEVVMADDGTGGDPIAGDNIYTAQLPAQPAPIIVSYYIWAEDVDGRTYTDPRDAPLETHAYTVAYIPPEVVVNEFLADNVATNTDEFGEYDDWVEIYNNGTLPIPLLGFCLTDNFAIPNKYVFPDTTLAPGDFLLVWCDNDAWQGPFHANFRLSATGERVGLFADATASFAVIDTVTFGPQLPDISFGRLPDGESRPFLPLHPPTPGTPNAATGVEPTNAPAPAVLVLGPGRPNPTAGRTTIPFGLPARGHVRLVVYNAAGRAVAELVDTEMSPGFYEVSWDGSARLGGGGPATGSRSAVPSGIYFYRLDFAGEVRTGKIALLR